MTLHEIAIFMALETPDSASKRHCVCGESSPGLPNGVIMGNPKRDVGANAFAAAAWRVEHQHCRRLAYGRCPNSEVNSP